MKALIEVVERLKKDPINETIKDRMKEFESFRNKNSNEIFKELCFCLMTANFSAIGGIKIQNALGDGFFHFRERGRKVPPTHINHRPGETRYCLAGIDLQGSIGVFFTLVDGRARLRSQFQVEG